MIAKKNSIERAIVQFLSLYPFSAPMKKGPKHVEGIR